MSFKNILTIAALAGFAVAAPTPQADTSSNCNPGTSFTLKAVSSDPSIDGISLSTTGYAIFLNSTNTAAATFFQNETSSLYVYSDLPDAPLPHDWNSYFVYNSGIANFGDVPDNAVRGDFSTLESDLIFEPSNDNGNALNGWWACPYTTVTGKYYTVANGANGFSGSINLGFGPITCSEFVASIENQEDVLC